MSKGQKLRALVNERLTAAAEEIFELFERTIAEYEEEVHTLKQRNNTQQQLLDQVLEPRVLLHRTGVQIVSVRSEEEVGPSLEPPHIKEEPEEEQLQEFPFTTVSVKTEDDEDKSSVLHQRPTEENREETNGEECEAEAGCSSGLLTHLHSDSEGHSSDHTDHSEDWTQDEPPLETCSSLINPDSSEKDAGERSKRHKCSECEKRFRRKDHLQRHMLTHTGERPFSCLFCNKGFFSKRDLIVHIRIHTGEKPFSCSVCQKEFIQKCSLKTHMSIHTGEKPFSCSVCQKEFIQLYSLKLHMKTHTGEKPFSCSVCKKTFSDQSYLRKHMRRHAAVKPFSCSVCQKCFGDQGTLSKHTRIHTGEKPFKCSVCQKCFMHKHHLNKHTRIHTREKPFKCSVCQKCFMHKHHLNKHMKTHTRAGALSPEQKVSERGGAETAGGAC